MNFDIHAYLYFDYMRKFTKLSLDKIGDVRFSKDHATVMHGLSIVNDDYINGWRKDARDKFRTEVDDIHKEVGIEKTYKSYEQSPQVQP